jgi:uncharacterized repeat protein (TIGR01451 family)
VLSVSLAAVAALLPALVPAALAAEGLSLTTPYPAVTVTPGTSVPIELTVDADEAARVELTLSGVPSTWTAELRGGGFVVGAVQVNGTDPTEVRLDVDVPDDATGTTRINVRAEATGTVVNLPIDITVQVGAGGAVTLEPTATALQGASDESFSFSVTVRNDKEEDVTFTADASGPTPDWEVDATATGQGQAVSATVRAGATSTVTVSVSPPDDTPAGTYPINLVVSAGGETLEQALEVVITGSYSMNLSTQTGVLSVRGPAGSVTTQQFTITNTGTAPITNVTLSATPPSDWEITYEPESVAAIAPGEFGTITARIQPSGDAIAGDYSITFRAGSEEADDDTADVRFTVETSILGGLIALGLIALVVGGLYWVFRRYGRR